MLRPPSLTAWYDSQERGRELVEGERGMNPLHARRAVKAIEQGRRFAPPATIRALKRQGRSEYRSDN